MIRKYKVLIKQVDSTVSEVNSDLVSTSGYLAYPNTSNASSELVTVHDVKDFMSSPDNANVVSGFTQYLRSILDEPVFNNIFYDSNKLAPLLNDYYKRKVRLNIPPTESLVVEVLNGSANVFFGSNNFELNGHRINEQEKKIIIQESEEESYYIDVLIDKRDKEIYSSDISKYVADCVEDGVVLRNCFVNLNRQEDPFDNWNIDSVVINDPNYISWPFVGTFWSTSPGSPHKLGFAGKTEPPFFVGDSINLKQAPGADFQSYNGATSVQRIERSAGHWIVVIDKPYKGGQVHDGEINNQIWDFTDNYFVEHSSPHKLGFIGFKKPPFIVGKSIDIQQDNGAKFKSYNGKAIVEFIINEGARWIVVINKRREGNTPVNPGRIINW